MASLGHCLEGTGSGTGPRQRGVPAWWAGSDELCAHWCSLGAPGLGAPLGSPWCRGLCPPPAPTGALSHHPGHPPSLPIPGIPSPFSKVFPAASRKFLPSPGLQGRAWDVISAHDFIPGDHSRGIAGSCLRELPQHQGSSQSVPCGHLSPAASSANIHPQGAAFLSSSRSSA